VYVWSVEILCPTKPSVCHIGSCLSIGKAYDPIYKKIRKEAFIYTLNKVNANYVDSFIELSLPL